MLLTQYIILTFMSLGLVQASPTAPRDSPQRLSFDDVVLLGNDGSSKVLKESEYNKLAARSNVTPNTLVPQMRQVLNRRGCEQSTEIEVISDTQFTNSDVAMSPVVNSAGSDSDSLAVSRGYSIANSVTVTAGADITLVKDILGLSFSIAYAQTWTTTDTQTFTFSVPDNQYGLIVSQPLVRRILGQTISGCTDNPTRTDFTADSYSSKAFGGLDWVTGIIRLCNSTTYPVSFCSGEGEHY